MSYVDDTALELANMALDEAKASGDAKIVDHPRGHITHELRLQGEALDGRLQWLVGGYYSDEKIRSVTDFSLGADTDQFYGAFAGGAVGPFPIQLITGTFGLIDGVDPAKKSRKNQLPLGSVWSMLNAGSQPWLTDP